MSLNSPHPGQGEPGSGSRLHRDTGRLFVYAVPSKVMDLGRAWLLAWLLGPAGYGLWQAVGLALTWAGQFHLGTVNTLSRELPMALAGGDQARQRTLCSQSALAVVALAVPVGALSLAWGAGQGGADAWVWTLAAPLFVLNAYHLYLLEVLEGSRRFDLTAKGELLYSALLVLLVLPLAPWLGVPGVVAACLLQRAATIYYLHRQGPAWRGLPRPDWSELRRMVTAGRWFWLATLSTAAYLTVDRLLVLGLLSGYELGLYALAWAATSPLRIWIGSLETAAEPRILALLAQEEGADSAPHKGGGFLRLIWCFPWCQAMAFFVLPPVIALVLPRYAEAVPAMQLAALGAYVQMAGVGAASFLLGQNRGKELLRNSLYTAGASLVLSLAAITAGLGITGVMAAALAAELFRSWHLLGLCQEHGLRNRRAASRVLSLRLLPWSAMLACLAVSQGAGFLIPDGWSLAASLGFRAAFFSVLYLGLACCCLRRSGQEQSTAWFPMNAV
jgi:O-antigen/teichoic acid export membrane protein